MVLASWISANYYCPARVSVTKKKVYPKYSLHSEFWRANLHAYFILPIALTFSGAEKRSFVSLCFISCLTMLTSRFVVRYIAFFYDIICFHIGVCKCSLKYIEEPLWTFVAIAFMDIPKLLSGLEDFHVWFSPELLMACYRFVSLVS